MSRSRARWLIPDFPSDEIAALSRATGISMPAARVLWKRGVQTPQAVTRFLHPNIDDCHDPFLLADMAKAAQRVRDAITRRDKILLYGDYDVDGTSSIVILHTVLKLAGADVAYHVPHRILEGYGMRGEVVDQARADNVNLIISVDTGIRATEVVERANAHGIDVIVTDHHLPEAALPPALAVINPNRPDCNYPEKSLCGAAVAWKLAHAIMKQLDWPEARRVMAPKRTPEAPKPQPAEKPVTVSDFVCEADVRDAIRAGRKIYISAKAIVTPSARELANMQKDELLISAQR